MDSRALIDLFMDERARFVRWARSRLETEADAEDVVQRAMMRAAERAHQLADPGRARAWFYRILRRAIVDHHRNKRLEVGHEVLDEEASWEDADRLAFTCRCTLRMLRELGPAYADVLREVDFEGQAPRVVAGALDVSMTNLYVRLHRARRALRERVEEHCGVSSIGPCLDCTCDARGRCEP
ncbi:MAG: sigma-70 family RNA polymerase sigma factor [Polyangiaceae bacterium]|nr:sigma-70 family RNA polymerase sigma factor [Polyangiaceae bacterium]